jgi:glycosyltransferase involved in cell wall biosynthesis
MKVALVCPSRFKETAFVKFETEYVKCMQDFIEIDYLSDDDAEYNGVRIRRASLDRLSGYDVLHFQWGNNPLHYFEYSLLKKMWFSGLRKPIVSTLHEAELRHIVNSHQMRVPENFRYMLRYPSLFFRSPGSVRDNIVAFDILSGSNVGILHSEYAKNRLLSDFPQLSGSPVSLRTARLGIDSSQYSSSRNEGERFTGLSLPRDKMIFLYVGFLHRIKSVDKAIMAFHLVKKYRGRDDFFFVIVGGGPELDNLKKLAKSLIPENSLVTGFVDSVVPYYSLADVVINPREYSKGEISGAIPEAFASGKPVICPAFGGSPEYVSDETGIATLRDHPLDYMEAILFFLENPEQAVKKGANAMAFCKREMDWRSQAGRIVFYYEEALKSEGKADFSKLRGLLFDKTYLGLNLAYSVATYAALAMRSNPMNLDYSPANPKYMSDMESMLVFGRNEMGQLGTGWNNLEFMQEPARWTNGCGVIFVPNPSKDAKVVLRVLGGPARDFSVWSDGRLAYSGLPGNGLTEHGFILPKSGSVKSYIRLEVRSRPFIPGPHDRRRLGILVSGCIIEPI